MAKPKSKRPPTVKEGFGPDVPLPTAPEPSIRGKRPLQYRKDVLPKLLQIEQMARAGDSNEEIARALKIPDTLFNKYLSKIPELMNAVHLNRGIAHLRVERSLYEACFKATFHRSKFKKAIIKRRDKDDPDSEDVWGMTLSEVTVTEVPADQKAIETWLQTHRPDLYHPLKAKEVGDGQDAKRRTWGQMVKLLAAQAEIEGQRNAIDVPSMSEIRRLPAPGGNGRNG